MRRLILIRHGKSSWSDPDLADHDRPLNQRGRLAAALMGAWLADRSYVPDVVLCSSSVRTTETLARMQPSLGATPDVIVQAQLYHADPVTMLQSVQQVSAAAATAALIGHQPGIGAFARKLATADAPSGCTRAFQKFPTCACAVLDFDVENWAEIAFDTGQFAAFAVPRELV